MLGAVCGNLVLATGAWGGVYLCGSVVKAWLNAGATVPFHTAMCAKGAMCARMARVPVYEIAARYPALTGLSRITLGDARR
jgi:glucokinase